MLGHVGRNQPLKDLKDLKGAFSLLQVRGVMLAAHPGSNFGPWDINAGVMLWDLRKPLTAPIIGEWTKRCSRALENGGGDDQSLLHHTLRDHLLRVGFNGTDDGTSVGRRAAAALGVVAGLPSRGSVKHYIRPVATDWTGNSVARRVKDAQKDLANIKF